jgi:hypothetical protein
MPRRQTRVCTTGAFHSLSEPVSKAKGPVDWKPSINPRPIAHFENATPHHRDGIENCFQSCQFHHIPQPPVGPDISPCVFFLSNGLKTKLVGEQFHTLEELQRRVDQLLGQVTSDTMRRVYEHWIERLK